MGAVMLEFRMPQFGMGMTDGTIIRWHKAEGDSIEAGEPLLDVEAAKTTVEVPAPAKGVLARIVVAADGNVPVNSVIAMIAQPGEGQGDLVPGADNNENAGPGEGARAPVVDRVRATPLARRTAERDGVDLGSIQGSGVRGKVRLCDLAAGEREKVQIEPRARRAARELDVDLSMLAGSGPNGRVIEQDVRDAAAARRSAEVETRPPAPAAGRLEKHSMMRRTIARRLTESKQTVPHFYLRASCEVGALLALRAQINDGQTEAKLSINDFVVRAAALALRQTPAANLSWTDEGMLHYDSVDIAVAVSTPRGLVTPVVRDVDAKPIRLLSQEIRDLAARGREGKLSPDEYRGGSSSVSNLGMYGTEEFSAIINPPQASIFAVGASEQRPVVRDGAVVPAWVMAVTLSVDHRAIDGAVGAQLLAAFKRLIEHPAQILA